MRFKKLNEHTVECFITKQDLEEYGMSMEDLIKNPEKTNDFVHKVVSMSQKAVDFTPDNSVLQAQIMPYEEGIVMIVFDKPTEKLGEYFISQLKKRIYNAMNNADKNKDDDDLEGGLDFLNSLEEMTQGSEGESEDVRSALKAGEEKCYLFTNFENLMDFIKVCPKIEGMTSKLHYQDKTYFLTFDKGTDSEKLFAEFCGLAEEYGYMSADSDTRIQLIKEHTTPIIARDAVGILKDSIM